MLEKSICSEKCGICDSRAAAIFMVVREGTRTAKGYVCVTCFEGVQEQMGGGVEAVSLQEWKEIEDNAEG